MEVLLFAWGALALDRSFQILVDKFTVMANGSNSFPSAYFFLKFILQYELCFILSFDALLKEFLKFLIAIVRVFNMENDCL